MRAVQESQTTSRLALSYIFQVRSSLVVYCQMQNKDYQD
jgi:hypothetical protein